MIRKDVIAKIVEKTELPEKEVALVYKAFTETVIEALKEGDKVQLTGFGTFEVGERAAREGRNPFSGEVIQIPAARTPKFKAGKSFKEAVNG